MPARYVRSLLKILPQAQRAEIVQQLDLNQQALDKDQPIAIAQYAQLFSLLLNRLQSVLHGEQAETIQRFSCYRLMLESMSLAPDLSQALERATICFRRLASNQGSIAFEVDDNQAQLIFNMTERQPEDWSIDYFSRDRVTLLPGLMGHATLLWIWHRLISWLIGSHIPLDAVKFREAVPPHPEKYRQLFDAEVQFQQDQAALVFPKRYLDYPVVQTSASVDHLLDVFLLPLFEIDQQDDSVSSQVKALIGSDFSSPIPSFNTISERLGVTPPTLHRRLHKEDNSYQKIKDECRKKAATDLLLYSKMPIRLVAERLGFSDNGTFHRAFRKWTGMTPTEFRNSQ